MLNERTFVVQCDIILILIFKLHRRTPRSSIHSLKIRVTSHPCNKYEQIMLSYLLVENTNIDKMKKERVKKERSCVKCKKIC